MAGQVHTVSSTLCSTGCKNTFVLLYIRLFAPLLYTQTACYHKSINSRRHYNLHCTMQDRIIQESIPYHTLRYTKETTLYFLQCSAQYQITKYRVVPSCTYSICPYATRPTRPKSDNQLIVTHRDITEQNIEQCTSLQYIIIWLISPYHTRQRS